MADPDDLEDRLRRYVAAVRRSPHNLLSRRALDELETRHVPESVAFARMLPSGKVLDVGSGGGLPGLVIALVRPDLSVTLLEATRKKASFLRETAADLGLEVEVIHGRAEETDARHGEFDVVTARAVAPLQRLIAWTVPFLTPHGRVYAIKGARWREEVDEAAEALQRYGARVVDVVHSARRADAEVNPLVVILGRDA